MKKGSRDARATGSRRCHRAHRRAPAAGGAAVSQSTTSARFRAYMATVTALGLSLFAGLAFHAVGRVTVQDAGALVVLAALLTVSELCPLTVHRLGDRNTITLSAIFACAMLLRWD